MSRDICKSLRVLVLSLLVYNINATSNGSQNIQLQQPITTQPGNNPVLLSGGINLGQSGTMFGNHSPFSSNPFYQYGQTSIAQFPENQLTNSQDKSLDIGKRTCLAALQSSISNGIYDDYCIFDLSNTIDFAQSADFVTQKFFSQIQLANIKYIYMDLYNSSVTDTYVNKWSTMFRQSGIQVLWNLSGNKTVSDQTIAMLGSLENIIGLNISGTSVTDLGANQLATMLSSTNPISIDFINIYQSQISEQGFKILEIKFIENSTKWNAINPNKKLNRRGIINDLGIKKLTNTESNKTNIANQEQRLVNQSSINTMSPLLNRNSGVANTILPPFNGLNNIVTGQNTVSAEYATPNMKNPVVTNSGVMGTNFRNLTTTGVANTNTAQVNHNRGITTGINNWSNSNNWNNPISKNNSIPNRYSNFH